MNQKIKGYRTIDIASISRDVFRQWWVIILFATSVALLFNVVSEMRYSPVYSSSATFVVTSRGTNTSIYQNIDNANDTAVRFRAVLQSNILKRAIAKELGVPEYNADTTITVLNETNLIVLTVQHKNAFMAYRYIRSIMNNYSAITDFVIKNVILDVVEEPQIPMSPSNIKQSRVFTGIGFLTGAFLITFYIAYFSYMKDTVKNPSEASSKIAARLLGSVYHENRGTERRKTRKNAMIITNPILSFRYSESCRMAASRVRSRMDRKDAKVLLVTSVAENEGKSTIAANIALALSQEGNKVLLIDADFRKPSLYKIFDINKEYVTNLVNILRTGEGMNKAIIKFKAHPLYFILNNTNTGSIDDVLANNRFYTLVRFAKTKFDYVILDTAPMGLVPDAEGIAEFCDASVVVVREDTILARNINDAIDTLNETNAPVLGVIFNDARAGMPGLRTGNVYGFARNKTN